MRAYKLIQCVILFFVIMACLFACRTVDMIAREDGIYDGVLLNEEGGLTVIEAKSRTRVPVCYKMGVAQHYKTCPCKSKTGFTEEELKKLKEFYNKFKVLDPDPNAELIDIIVIKEFKGSWCRSFYSSATYDEFPICRPPY